MKEVVLFKIMDIKSCDGAGDRLEGGIWVGVAGSIVNKAYSA